MEFLRRAHSLLNQRREVFRREFRPRQESSSASSSPAASKSGVAAPTGSLSTNSTANSTTDAAAKATGPVTVTETVTTPPFTATKTTAYEAHGVNATFITHNNTFAATSVYTAAEYLATSNATAHGIPHNELTACQINGTQPDNGPFCSPLHQQNLWVGYTYAVTWNPVLFGANESDTVILKYDEGSQDIIWTSLNSTNGTAKPQGFVNINMDTAWLRGAPGNDSTSGQNLTFFLANGVTPDNLMGATNTKGPQISLVVNPKTLPPIPVPKLPAKYGLEIGLPVGVAAVFIIILAFWCNMRRSHRSWNAVKGHGRDYMSKRSRRRGRVEKGGEIQLEDMGRSRGEDAFTDEPYTGGSDNVFRAEVARQREEDEQLRTHVTSY